MVGASWGGAGFSPRNKQHGRVLAVFKTLGVIINLDSNPFEGFGKGIKKLEPP